MVLRHLSGKFSAIYLSGSTITCSFSMSSVQALEAQIADLESEAESLSRSVEAHKLNASEIDLAGQKKIEDLSREVQKKVTQVPFFRFEYLFISFQSTEADQLRTKLKQLGDYDEIKRELAIMKVCFPIVLSLCV